MNKDLMNHLEDVICKQLNISRDNIHIRYSNKLGRRINTLCGWQYVSGYHRSVDGKDHTVVVYTGMRTIEEYIFTLIHELRHVWQYKTGIFNGKLWNGAPFEKNTETAPQEIDARSYADQWSIQIKTYMSPLGKTTRYRLTYNGES